MNILNVHDSEHSLAHDECEPVEVAETARFKNMEVRLKSQLTHSQKVTLSFMKSVERRYLKGGGFISSELGSGKTLAALAHIFNEGESAANEYNIIFAPASVAYTWKAQVEMHFEGLQVYVYHGHTKLSRLLEMKREGEGSGASDGVFIPTVLIVPYSTTVMMSLYQFVLSTGVCKRMFLDESHELRNGNTQRYRNVLNLLLTVEPTNVWCITGTPIWNQALDLRWQLRLTGYPNYEMHPNLLWRMQTDPVEIMREFMIRRTKQELNLPDRIEFHQYIDMNDSERLLYEALRDHSEAKVRQFIDLHEHLRDTSFGRTVAQRASANMFCLISRLRQMCVCPTIVMEALGKYNISGLHAENLSAEAIERVLLSMEAEEQQLCAICFCDEAARCIIPCGHRFCLDCIQQWQATGRSSINCPTCRGPIVRHDLIENAVNRDPLERNPIPTNDVVANVWPLPPSKFTWILNDMSARNQNDSTVKFIVFSQWTRVLDHFRTFLADTPFSDALRIDGKQSLRKRSVSELTFSTKEEEHRLLLVSLHAGGVGLNLQRGSVVYFLDPSWSPSREDQAGDRAHRLGQQREVEIIHLICRDSVEERVLQVQERKRDAQGQLLGNQMQFVMGL